MSPLYISEHGTARDDILKEMNGVRRELYRIEAELDHMPVQEKKELYKYLVHVHSMLKSAKRA
ncbi:hypothetical protein GGI20_001597 [Coemansia sp. BCRC 34301]|nr:hypothetical protein GGI20_001597 [Coemansia sp. BCRC 34301]